MSGFGFIAPDLQPCAWWNRWNGWLPDKWRYFRGPLAAGELVGSCGALKCRGWGWKAPVQMERLWKEGAGMAVWKRLSGECLARDIQVVGLPRLPSVALPEGLERPKLTDGNSLELVLFKQRFLRGFPRTFLATSDCEVAIIWEEGNLGLVCARLLGAELRFLTLIHPLRRAVDDAAALLLAETGLAAKVRVELPQKWSKFKIIIQCGQLNRYSLLGLNGQIYYRLFQGPDWPEVRTGMPLQVQSRFAPISVNVVIGEAFLRTVAGMEGEHWYGPAMKLQRVFRMETALEKLQMNQLGANGSA